MAGPVGTVETVVEDAPAVIGKIERAVSAADKVEPAVVAAQKLQKNENALMKSMKWAWRAERAVKPEDLDKDGKLVEALTKKGFQISDDGKKIYKPWTKSLVRKGFTIAPPALLIAGGEPHVTGSHIGAKIIAAPVEAAKGTLNLIGEGMGQVSAELNGTPAPGTGGTGTSQGGGFGGAVSDFFGGLKMGTSSWVIGIGAAVATLLFGGGGLAAALIGGAGLLFGQTLVDSFKTAPSNTVATPAGAGAAPAAGNQPAVQVPTVGQGQGQGQGQSPAK